ncbi:MAG: hypothetical protein NTY48_01245 [Candidatus Diapherotrites archaeon]|nr:hypothetical protein [Candidatus Diapherotrites archaeon]
MNTKGQITVEFIIVVVLIAIVFVFSVALYQDRQNENQISSEKWSAQLLANRIARNINSVYFSDGNAVLTDPIVIKGLDVNVIVAGGGVRVFYPLSMSMTTRIATRNVTYNVTDLNGFIFFRKIDGNVTVGYS